MGLCVDGAQCTGCLFQDPCVCLTSVKQLPHTLLSIRGRSCIIQATGTVYLLRPLCSHCLCLKHDWNIATVGKQRNLVPAEI